MVRGFDYGVQYEIELVKPLDLYNDILPICMGVRNMIQYNIVGIDKVSKLIIVPYGDLNFLFKKQEFYGKYIYGRTFIKSNGFLRINRITNPEEFKYFDVKIFNDYIKTIDDLPKPITNQMLNVLEKRLNELINMYDDIDYISKYSQKERLLLSNERNELDKIIKIQRIIMNENYYNEIESIYNNLTNIELTSDKILLIDKVLNHPKLNGFIANHGMRLVDIVC